MKLEMVSNPNYYGAGIKNILKLVRDSMLYMIRTDSVARNKKKTVFFMTIT